MKYVIAAFGVTLAIGFAACGGSDTTTVIKHDAAPVATQPTQPQQTGEEKLADAFVQAYGAEHPNMCAAFGGALPYDLGLRAFTKGYLSTNPGNYPDAKIVYDAVLTYCEDITA